MTISLATKGMISFIGSGGTILVPSSDTETIQSPHQVLLDLLQSEWHKYINDTENIALFMANRPRLLFDPLPALYVVPRINEVSQSGIPLFKKTVDKFEVSILYYTDNTDIIFAVQQVIKQIIVSNNKVQNTPQFTGSGIEWISIKRFEYDNIYLDEEYVISNLIGTVEIVYQNTYI